MKSSLTRLLTALVLPASLAQANPIDFQLEQVANSSQTAPSGNGYTASDAFREPGVSSTGAVAFRSSDANFDQFIEAGTPGALSTIASSGDPVPASSTLPANSTYDSFDDNVQIEGDTALFTASPNVGGSGVDFDQQFLVQSVSGVPTVVLQELGTVSPVTGLPISRIDNSEGYGLGVGRSVYEINETNAAEDKSILLFQGGSLSVIQTETDTPPIGTAYRSLSDPYADRNGPGIIFQADMDSGALESLLLTEDNGATLSVVAQTGDSVTGSTSSLTSIFEGEIDFGNIAVEVILDNGNQGVVFIPTGGGLQAVAEVGTTVAPGGGVLTLRNEVSLSGETVFFDGEVNGDDVLLAWNDGMLTEILRAGDVLDGITVEDIAFNRGGAAGEFFGFSISGTTSGNPASAVYRGTFSVTPDPVLVGDYNNSGQVEQGDLDIVLQNWGTATFTGDENALVGGGPFDGTVDQNELDGVLQNWGSTSAPDFDGGVVPEPASLALLSLGGLMLARRH